MSASSRGSVRSKWVVARAFRVVLNERLKAFQFLFTLAALMCSPLYGQQLAAPQNGSSYTLTAAEQTSYDDNVFRLPASTSVVALAGADASRTDVIETASLATDLHWYYANQTVVVRAQADENHYFRNSNLSNVSGRANLDWNWQLGYRLSGQVGIDYVRVLASFSNSDFYARDMVDRVDYFANMRYLVASRWSLYGGVLGADTWLSAPSQRVYDLRSKGGNAGIEFASASDNTVNFEYRYINARFPQIFYLNAVPFNSDYDEDTAQATVKYAVSDATQLELAGGYLRRNYPFANFGAFSGGIGHISLTWQPTDALLIKVTGRHELRAYIDAESDYFVANGGSLEPTWKVSETIALSLEASYENHNYISSSPSAISFASRHDKVFTQKAKLVYNPARLFTATLAYQYARRDSNRPILMFADDYVTANFAFKFGL